MGIGKVSSLAAASLAKVNSLAKASELILLIAITQRLLQTYRLD